MSDTYKVHKLAKAYNALPLDDTESTVWYFDIRYIPFYPPYHLLTVYHPSSGKLHSERITVADSVLKYFPETGAEAAAPATKALLRAFIALGVQPQELRAQDDELTDAVNAELINLGVDDLCVHLDYLDGERTCDRLFKDHFETLKATIGIDTEGIDIATPANVSLDSIFKMRPLPPAVMNDDVSEMTNAYFAYVQQVLNSEPPMGKDVNAKVSEAPDRVYDLQLRVSRLPLHIVKRGAVEGDPESAFDYGMRLWVGLGCAPDRHKAYKHLVHAAISPSASNFARATAHGVLTSWHVPEGATPLMRPRGMIASAYHANEAAIFCRKASPTGERNASPYVFRVVKQVYLRVLEGLPHIRLVCKEAVKAWEEDEARQKAEERKMNKKVSTNPARYRCANPSCQVAADTGKMFSQCAGKCDVDKKPHYCSKVCQKEDWSHHKPYCKPGAESSVAGLSARWNRPSHHIHYQSLDAEDDDEPVSRPGAYQVQLPNGQTLSSATVDPETLKVLMNGFSAM